MNHSPRRCGPDGLGELSTWWNQGSRDCVSPCCQYPLCSAPTRQLARRHRGVGGARSAVVPARRQAQTGHPTSRAGPGRRPGRASCPMMRAPKTPFGCFPRNRGRHELRCQGTSPITGTPNRSAHIRWSAKYDCSRPRRRSTTAVQRSVLPVLGVPQSIRHRSDHGERVREVVRLEVSHPW
jgi:hypothetical protein